MMLDKQLQFSSSQALSSTGAAGETSIDLEVVRSIGHGTPLEVVISVEVAADQTSGDEDYTFDLEYATAADQSTGRQVIGRRVFESGTPAAPAQNADLLVAGYQFTIPVPAVSMDENARYLGIRGILAGSTPTITISAWLQPMEMVAHAKQQYANGYVHTV